jgi:hypothetical protein
MGEVLAGVEPFGLAVGGHSMTPTNSSLDNWDRNATVEAWDVAQASPESPRSSPRSPWASVVGVEAVIEEGLWAGYETSRYDVWSLTARYAEYHLCLLSGAETAGCVCLCLLFPRLPHLDMVDGCARNHSRDGGRRDGTRSHSGSSLRVLQTATATLTVPRPQFRCRDAGHVQQTRQMKREIGDCFWTG